MIQSHPLLTEKTASSPPHHESMHSLQPDPESSSIEPQALMSSHALTASAPINSKEHSFGGLPVTTRKIRTLKYKNYTVGFSDYYKLPLYTQRNFNVFPKNCTETGRGAAKFSVDSNLPVKLQLTHDDFNDPQCTSTNQTIKTQKCLRRGHLTANADVCALTDRAETFKTTNIAPQIQNTFNSGIWSTLEGCVQKWASENSDMIVNTGIIFKTPIKKLNAKVGIPKFYYKVITHPKTNTHIAFLMENKYYQKSERVLSHYLVSIDKIEGLSRLDLFPNLKLQENKERVGDEYKCTGL